MDATMEQAAKNGHKGLHLLAELSKQAASIGHLGDLHYQRYYQKGEYRDPEQTGMDWVNRCFAGHPRYFYKMFRINPDIFMSLHDLLVSNYGLKSSRNVSSMESLAMFLWIVGCPQSFSQVENQFERSLWTIHMKFKEVLLCLRKLGKDNIKPRDPTFSTEHTTVQEDRFWPHLKGDIGAIDGSHIRVSVPAEEVVNHTCQHGYTSQNVLAICNFNMRFTFLVAGWPDSAHDTRVLNHTLTNFGDEFPIPLAGKYYPLDSGYLNRTKYLAPFKGSIFHIPKFHLRRHRPLQGKYEKFNYLHSSFHNVIVRSFGVLKQKMAYIEVDAKFLTS
jgi:hypothetical protein